MNKRSCSGEDRGSEEIADDPDNAEVNENSGAPNLKSRRNTKGANWAETETNDFITLCIEHRVMSLMDGKRHKHADIYKSLEPKMKEKRYDKTGSQMRTKLKHLKEAYYKCKRGNSVSGSNRKTFPYYDAMDQLLGGRPSAEAAETEDGIDSSSQDQPLEIRQLTDEDIQHQQYEIANVDIIVQEVAVPDVPAILADTGIQVRPNVPADSTAQIRPAFPADRAAQIRPAIPVDRAAQIRPAVPADRAAPARPAAPADHAPALADPAAPIRPAAVAVNRGNKTGGRYSNAKRLENWSEGFAKKQADSLNEILITQNRMLDDSIRKQMIEQRNWEAQMMQQEREHQMLQMSMLMDGFLKGLQTMNNFPAQFSSYPPTFHQNVVPTTSVPNQFHSAYPFRVPSPMSTTVPLLSPSPSSSSTRPSPTQSPFPVGFPPSPSSSTNSSYPPSSFVSSLSPPPAINSTVDPSATESTFSTNFPLSPSPSTHPSDGSFTSRIPSPSGMDQGE